MVHPGTTIILDGTGSSDPDGDYPLTFAWSILTKPSGSNATLVVNEETPSMLSFTPDLFGDYTIQLIVTDSLGASRALINYFVTRYG